MIAKKNRKANLERKRFAFFQIGLLVSGSLCLAAFEYSTVSDATSQIEMDDPFSNVLQPEPSPVDVVFKPKVKKQAPKVINLDKIDSIDIVDKFTKDGNFLTTTNNNFVNMGGDGADGTFEDWGLVGESGIIFEGAVDKEPEFKGGMAAMFEWLQRHISYPELAREMGIQGTVYVQFVVNTNGSICQVSSEQSPHKLLTDEALRVVNKMPKWTPGEQAGKQVRVKYTLPINFTQL